MQAASLEVREGERDCGGAGGRQEASELNSEKKLSASDDHSGVEKK